MSGKGVVDQLTGANPGRPILIQARPTSLLKGCPRGAPQVRTTWGFSQPPRAATA